MTPELDQGDIVSQIEFDLGPHDTYSQLYAKLITTIPNLLAQFADFLVTSGCKTIPQDMSKSTYFRNDRQIHRRIFWAEMDAVQIHNLVRACNGNAYFWHGQQQVLVRQVEPAETNRNMTNNIKVPPGTVVDIRNGIPVIAVRSGFVILLHITAKWFRKPSFSIGQILS
jgi:methionyl-tRNA formyltransferase